jgi:GNAT superfamily N-acetyltransferase
MAIEIRSLGEDDVAAAERLRRLAFGTLLGLPDPLSFRGDAALLGPRRQAFPDGGLVAAEDGELLGVAMANHWGSLGIFGPVAVHPQQWRRGIARSLLEASLPIFTRWNSRVVGLFTFPERIPHVRLYQSAGFWPRYLTAIMARAVTAPSPVPEAISLRDHLADRNDLIAQCAALTDSIFEGLDLTREIELIVDHGLGDAILIAEDSRVAGFAICHAGKGSEAGSGAVYVKFAALRSGARAPRRLALLIDACNDFAHRRGATQISAGVNLGRMIAYRLMIDLGFRATLHGVAMHRPWVETYDRPEIFALDDWR